MKNAIERAIALHSKGQYLSARRLIFKTYGKNLAHPDGFYFMSKNELCLGNFEKAIDWGKKAINVAPLKSDYHVSLAEAYRRDGDLIRAEWECRLALRLDENSAEAFNILGLVLKGQNKYQEAIQAFSQAIDKKRPYFEAMNNLATVLIRTGDYDFAKKYLQLILRYPLKITLLGTTWDLALRNERCFEDAKESLPQCRRLYTRTV